MEFLMWSVLAIAIFAAGFFTGKKKGYRVAEMEQRIKNTLGGK